VFIGCKELVTVVENRKLRLTSVDTLKAGMFLVGICRQRGNHKVSNPGRISPEQIAQLRKQGVTQVMIDPSRGLPDEARQAMGVTEVEPSDKDQSMLDAQRALQAFRQAKVIQKKYFLQIGKGEAIDIAPLQAAADDLIEGLDRHSDALLCLARIREKDQYLMEHSLNVGMLLAYLGRSMGMDRFEQRELLIGGMLHDVGKIETPDEVLHKPGRLTDREFDVMKEHVVHSNRILSQTPGITNVMLEVASNHHERIDGTGYPKGLGRALLSRVSQMSSIVDCYDALTADRVYKSGMPPTAAFRIMLKGVGTQFEKGLLDRFIHCMGVYPAGTWVKLVSGKIGLVIKRNAAHPLKPVIRIVYSTNTNNYLPVKEMDLAKQSNESIDGAVSARDYDIDVVRFSALD
jgi:putative nucleotidyltransferase with HDIG domain